MAAFFFDTSAVMKRYVAEIGTTWIRSLVTPSVRNRIGIARITGVEMIAAVARRQRAGHLTLDDADLISDDFAFHMNEEYELIAVTPRLLGQAMTLAAKHALRGYDAVQLAAGLTAHRRWSVRNRRPMAFVSADVELNAAAAAEGLTVEDPNLHP